MKTVYFDHASTTPLDERVFDAMLPFLKNEFGNANSAHQLGRTAKVAVEDARESIAHILNAEPSEIIFTSGGTESDNAVIKGVMDVTPKREIISTAIEHHAVVHTIECTKRSGGKPVYLSTGSSGIVTAQQVADAITENTALVSLMHVNNEIGSVMPLKEIAAVCREKKVPLHSDTVQSIGKIPVDVKDLDLDFLSMSAHKIYGPKGIGVMYVKNSAPWMPWMKGGSQERRRRGGTLNVAGIVGAAKALELAVAEMDEHRAKYESLRSHLLNGLEKSYKGQFQINGSENGVAHIINLTFLTPESEGLDGEMLLLNLDIEGICVSNGSACTSGAMEPSHVLTGIGLPVNVANSSIRISFGKDNTTEQVDYFLEKLGVILNRMMATA
jgi:cysteine desulfurase